MSKIIKEAYSVFIISLTKLSPAATSRLIYWREMKRSLNLRSPASFSEKLMKLKLDNYLGNRIVWQCVDKLTIRSYAKERGVTERNLPKLLGVYRDARDIDFDKLPRKFALKCTHGAGFNIICKDKDALDRATSIAQLNKWLVTQYGLSSAETHYGKVKPSIICEEFIEGDGSNLPSDYKVYCFSGEPRYVMVCTQREERLSKVNLFDKEWDDTGYIKPEFASDKEIAPPKTLSEMIEMARKVSKEFPFVRVDFYEDKGVPILGEMTFTPHACMNSNMTEEGQLVLGKLIDLKYQMKGHK